ncbi:MAG TPA: HipA family kinase [Solirubrobacteraceae bacterium]|nr:HipA family kinase [Solirubrobacteraceae bacterium]
MRRVRATRYVTPLREGGSLPGLVEADDDGLYVLKFRGAGQGPAALAADALGGELARALGLPVPELVVLDVDPDLGRAEPDPEIQDLITSSGGENLGVDFLPGALPFDAAAGDALDPGLAAAVVWLDGLLTNVDRTPRNPNLLAWHGRVWLIDHGALLAVHQRGDARRPFPLLAEHALLPYAGPIADADARLADRAAAALAGALAAVPDAWLGEDPSARRAELGALFAERLRAPRPFVAEAEDARAAA